MANLLVTGGAGFIGGNFMHYWRARHPGDRLLVLDALTYAGNRSTIADVSGVELVVGNICDTALVEGLLRDHAIDTLVHFAAESHVDRSISAPDDFIETNVVGTHSLLKAARSVWLEGSGQPHRFHHVSTDEVYGSLGPNDPAFSETTAVSGLVTAWPRLRRADPWRDLGDDMLQRTSLIERIAHLLPRATGRG